MKLKFDLLPGVLRVEIRERESAEDTREAARKALAEREKHGAPSLLIVVKDSRAIFKVEKYGLSEFLRQVEGLAGLRAAAVSDDSAQHAAHQYVELIARQRGVAFRAFTSEQAALDWLREPR